MYLPQRLSGKRGASVLAALVLVAILGAALLVFQYIRSSGDFAYEPQALLAATAAGDNGVAQSSPSSTATCDYKTQSCSCNSDEKNTTSGSITSTTQQCLPGCTYRISASAQTTASGSTAQAAKITTSGMSSCVQNSTTGGGCTPASLSQPCIKQYEDASGNIQLASSAGGSNLATESIASAPTPAIATDLGNMYAANNQSTDPGLQYLQTQLGGYQADQSPTAAMQDPTAVQQSNNATAALQAMAASPSNSPNNLPGPESGSGVQVPPTQVNPGTATDIQDPEIIAQQKQQAAQAAAQAPPAGCGAYCNGGSAGNTFQQTPPAATTAPAPAAKSNLLSTGMSFLTGLAQGITRGLQSQQLAQQIQAAQQASAPYGVGTDGLACPAPQQEPDPSQCTVGTWEQLRQSNNCPTTWQCVPTNSTGSQPSANISCQPQTADVGMSISISYACTNATGSTAGGFSTNNQLSGSATAVIAAPPAGTNTATYGLTCINQSASQSQVASAQCAVQISQPSIVLIANPSVVATSSSTAVGWVTSGMSACTISSPDSTAFTAANAGNTSVNGVATTPPLTAAMRVVLNCQTTGGGTRSAMTTVSVGTAGATGTSAGAAPISISSTADGASIAHGGSVTITWNSVNPPSGSAMSLWLVNEQTKAANAVIAGDLAVNGTYTWNVPAVGASCNPNASNVCDTDLVQGDSYAIEAVLYTPSTAYIGDGTAPASPTAPVYGASAVGGSFTLDDGASNSGGE